LFERESNITGKATKYTGYCWHNNSRQGNHSYCYATGVNDLDTNLWVYMG